MAADTNEINEGNLARLLTIALSKPDLSVLCEMLLEVARQLGAHGCALWQIKPRLPGMKSEVGIGEEKILAIAAGFHNRVYYPEHDLPSDVPSGYAMNTGKIQAVADTDKSFMPDRARAWLVRTRVKSLCAVRVLLEEKAGEKRYGSLTVYRQESGEWAPRDIELLELFAKHIPALYRTVRDRVSFRILEEVADVIRAAEEDNDAPEEKVRARIEGVCKAVSKGFQCLETAIYLENPLVAPGIYRSMATTCRKLMHRPEYLTSQPGLTPWVLRFGPIAVEDIRDFEQSRYQGLVWKNEVELEETFREALDLDPDDVHLPPISFMAVPIRTGKRVYGVIRCCGALRAPYYFAEREMNLLELIASSIGHYWSKTIDRQELSRELEMWKRFGANLSRFDVSAQNELTGETSDQSRILSAAITVARNTLLSSDFVDISLRNPGGNEISVVAAFDGQNVVTQLAPRQMSYKFDETPPRTPAARVFHSKTSYRISPDSEAASAFAAGPLGIRQAIYSPISADGEFLGVIAVRSKEPVEYPKQADEMLVVLGHLTGLYIRLQTAMRNQTQTYRLFLHQLRSPVFQAQKRTRKVRQLTGEKRLDAVCGLLGKARLLVINLRLFSGLAAGELIQPDAQTLNPGDLIRPLIELASDNRIQWLHRGIGFQVEANSFEVPGVRLFVDMDLFEQAAGNVLDNFGKYGMNGNETTVAARMGENRELCIVFRGQSIPISPVESQLAGQRGWRGREAVKQSAEGSGIGLWMARCIMEAHGGQLIVLPTDTDGYNEICWLFQAFDT